VVVAHHRQPAREAEGLRPVRGRLHHDAARASKNSKAYAILGGEPLTEITFRLPGLRWSM